MKFRADAFDSKEHIQALVDAASSYLRAIESLTVGQSDGSYEIVDVFHWPIIELEHRRLSFDYLQCITSGKLEGTHIIALISGIGQVIAFPADRWNALQEKSPAADHDRWQPNDRIPSELVRGLRSSLAIAERLGFTPTTVQPLARVIDSNVSRGGEAGGDVTSARMKELLASLPTGVSLNETERRVLEVLAGFAKGVGPTAGDIVKAIQRGGGPEIQESTVRRAIAVRLRQWFVIENPQGQRGYVLLGPKAPGTNAPRRRSSKKTR